MQYNNNDDRFTQEMINQWLQIGQRFFEDIPSFKRIWNNTIESVEPQYSENHPVTQLVKYMASLQHTCQQALYSIEQIVLFSNQESSNVTQFYIGHYTYDFVARVKTATDILALLMNHIFKLALPDQKCSLDRRPLFANELRKKYSNQQVRRLANKLENAYNNWLNPFYNVRNMVIHQPGFGFAGGSALGTSSHSIHIWLSTPSSIPTIRIDSMNPLATLEPFVKEKDPLSILLTKIKSKSISNLYVDPVKLCDELWVLLTELMEDLINEFEPQIVDFISDQKKL